MHILYIYIYTYIFQIFHGVIVSASQVVAVENAITGCVVYLAILLFSPKAASFAFLGAFIGSLTGIILFLQIFTLSSK